MSAVIKTTTPFTIMEVLFSALTTLGAEPILITAENINSFQQRSNITIGNIITNRKDYNGLQLFSFNGEVWQLQHDQDEYATRIVSATQKQYQSVSRFLNELNVTYKDCYQVHLEKIAELERQPIEQERIDRVAKTRLQAIDKAKAQGYSVKEKHIRGKIQLVLTRSV
jgi:antitoxin component of RelBE/YafQ-DinJ toxin-antitoxin module